MPTATLKSPRTLNKYGRKWVKGVEVPIDFKELAQMRGDSRFHFEGVKITVEADPDETPPEKAEDKPKRKGRGRTRTKVEPIAPRKTAKRGGKPAAKSADSAKPAAKKGGVKLVRKGAKTPVPAPEPVVDSEEDGKGSEGDTENTQETDAKGEGGSGTETENSSTKE